MVTPGKGMLLRGIQLPVQDKRNSQFLHRDGDSQIYIQKVENRNKPHRNAAFVKNLSIL